MAALSSLFFCIWGASLSTQAHGSNLPASFFSGEQAQKLRARDEQARVALRDRRLVLHTYLPSEVRADGPLVFYISGAGGWHSFDGRIAEALAMRGLPVCGLSLHTYLKAFYSGAHPATPAQVGADFADLIRQARRVADVDESRPALLAGWSLGAAYAVLAASDARIKPLARGVVSVAIARDNETTYSLRHALMSQVTGKTYGPAFDVAKYLGNVAHLHVALIQAEGDCRASPKGAEDLIAAARASDKTVRLFVVKGARNHRFDGGRVEFDRVLTQALEWIEGTAQL